MVVEPVRGQHGWVRLEATHLDGRTRLTRLESQPPVQVMRAIHSDDANPDLAFVTLCSPSGGILDGDRLEISLDLESRARVHLNTQSATRIYRMPHGHAEQQIDLRLEAHSTLEMIFDPYLPFADSELRQTSRWVVNKTATLIASEVVGAGREARGEIAAYRRFAGSLEVKRPDGSLLFRDTYDLRPDSYGIGLGPGWCALGTLQVVAPNFDSTAWKSISQEGSQVGWSDLPNQGGAWLKVLAARTETAQRVVTEAWMIARAQLLASPLPPHRRG
ncbi:MAG TPA: urease accessory protein UreD [Candidatus Dormibacteraeota bacterium]|nr:urease accessory protein UreD [Candidatus Dormibacteraeota bacterium]